jgi:AcrR family transcriptional regulator
VLTFGSCFWHTGVVTASTGRRARLRAELVRDIKNEARRQVTESGAPALSLRALARELGMVSTGIYRYFASRDELLTALIIDAYDDLGAAAESADASCERSDLFGRWRAACHAVRNWARDHPHEYALVYGSPVPGYRAPEETIGPAGRVTSVLAAVALEAATSGVLEQPFTAAQTPKMSERAAAEGTRIGAAVLPGLPADAAVRALAAWTQLFGFISFELFGHLVGVVEDLDAVFDQAVTDVGAFVGLIPPATPGRPSRARSAPHRRPGQARPRSGPSEPATLNPSGWSASP